MIVRIQGEGQYELDDSAHTKLDSWTLNSLRRFMAATLGTLSRRWKVW